MNRRILRVRDYLGHMLDAVKQVQQYTSGKDASQFLSDRLVQDAVVRNIEILGEAAKNLLDADPNAAPNSPAFPLPRFTRCGISSPTGTSSSISTSSGR